MLRELRDGEWSDGPQAYGELLALRCLVLSDDHDAASDLAEVLGSDGELTDKALRIRTGLAFTAAISCEIDPVAAVPPTC